MCPEDEILSWEHMAIRARDIKANCGLWMDVVEPRGTYKNI